MSKPKAITELQRWLVPLYQASKVIRSVSAFWRDQNSCDAYCSDICDLGWLMLRVSTSPGFARK
jgi:hypothetical protein